MAERRIPLSGFPAPRVPLSIQPSGRSLEAGGDRRSRVGVSPIREALFSPGVMMAGYLVLAVPLAYFSRFRLTPDGVAYIELARHWVNGSLELAINSYWSPLFSWLLTPAIAFDLPPVFLARMIGLASGLLFSWATYGLYLHCFGRRGSRALLASCLLVAVSWIPEPLSPDLLLSALVASYFLLTAKLLRQPTLERAMLCGVAGGVCYLAKSYALPFVGVHLFLSIFLLGPGSWRKRSGVFLISLLGLFLIVAPWILTISLHDGALTFGSASRYVRTWSPGTELSGQLPHYRIQIPREGRLSSWENPTEIPFQWPTWSPMRDWPGLRSQIWTLAIDLLKTCKYLFLIDLGGLVLLGFLVALWQLFRSGAVAVEEKRWKLWLFGSVGLYFSGYQLVLVWFRYLWPVIGLILVFTFAGLEPGARFRFRERRYRASRILTLAILLSLGLSSGITLYENAFVSGTAAAWLKKVSQEVQPHHAVVAANEWDRGIQFSFWSRVPFLGVFEVPADLENVQLKGSQSLWALVFDDPELADSLRREQSLRLMTEFSDAEDRRLTIFIMNPKP